MPSGKDDSERSDDFIAILRLRKIESESTLIGFCLAPEIARGVRMKRGAARNS